MIWKKIIGRPCVYVCSCSMYLLYRQNIGMCKFYTANIDSRNIILVTTLVKLTIITDYYEIFIISHISGDSRSFSRIIFIWIISFYLFVNQLYNSGKRPSLTGSLQHCIANFIDHIHIDHIIKKTELLLWRKKSGLRPKNNIL